MDIYLKEVANKKSSFRFPSMPDEDIEIQGKTNYQSYDILRKGTYSFPSGNDEMPIKWKGYFWGKPKRKSVINRKWVAPATCIKKLEKWRKKGTPLNLIVSGGGINCDVTIKSFAYKPFGGDGDYSYSITLLEYRPMKIYTTKELGIKKPKKKATSRPSPAKKKKTYTIVSGDNLWSIARKFYGGSGSDWKKIYDANKSVIETAAKKYGRSNSNNGWWIYPGTVLTIP